MTAIRRSSLGRRLALASLCLGAVAAARQVPAEPPDRINPCEDSSADWCLQEIEPAVSRPAVPERRSGGRSRRVVEPECGWVSLPVDRVPGSAVERRSDSIGGESRPAIFVNGQPTPGAEVSWQAWCYDAETLGYRGPFRWVPVGAEAPVLPTPEEVAEEAYEAIRGRLPGPVVGTSPPVGVEATVDVPVFVWVTNWQDEVVETRDLLDDLVTVTARPALVLDPAEPGAGAVACSGAGRPYDPAGGDLWVQAAAPGACAYAYRYRTGVEGRPALWPSTVVVRWSISWSATSGEGGEFPVVDRSVSIPRGVTEVQSVLVPEGR